MHLCFYFAESLKAEGFSSNEATEDLQCDSFEPVAINTWHLNDHKMSIYGQNFFFCDLCDNVADSMVERKEQIKNNHPEKVCNDCDFVAVAKGSIKRQIMGKRKNTLLKCDQCKANFTTTDGLHHHKTSTHQEIVYPCDICDSVFPKLDNLKMHRKSYHSEIYLQEKVQGN